MFLKYSDYPELRDQAGTEIKALLSHMNSRGNVHKAYVRMHLWWRRLWWVVFILLDLYTSAPFLAVAGYVLIIYGALFCIGLHLLNFPMRREFLGLYPAWLLVHKAKAMG